MKKWDFERAVFGSELSPIERLMLLCLSALANSSDCAIPAEHTPSLSRLKAMSGISSTSVARILNSLEEAGWIARKRPSVADSRQKKIRTQYRLKIPKGSKMTGLPSPEGDGLASPTTGLARPNSPHKASPTVGLASPTTGLELVPPRDTGLVPQWDTYPTAYPTITQPHAEPRSAATVVQEFTGASQTEAEAIANRIRNEKQPRSLIGLIRRMGDDGDLAPLLAEQRGAAKKAQFAAAIAELRKGPSCIHGEKGGAELHPGSKEPLCPQCRNIHRLQRRSA